MSLSGLTGSAPGGRLHCGCFAQGAEVVVMGNSYFADFHGTIMFLLDPNMLLQFINGAISLVPLLLQEQNFDGIGKSIGPITIRKDPDRDPLHSTISSIVSGQPFPAVQDVVINVHVTIPNLLPGITLRNKLPPNAGPTILRNSNMTTFPPQNDVYALVEPMELEDVKNPGPVLATIKSFPMTMNPATP